jgi:hypothetical protein
MFAESADKKDFGVFPLITAVIKLFETAARRLLKSIRDIARSAASEPETKPVARETNN